MKVGVLTVPFSAVPLQEVIPYLHGLGVQSVELGTGGFTNKAHCNPQEYFRNPNKIQELRQILAEHNMEISALSCHGNPVHPNQKTAREAHEVFVQTVELAEELGVDTIVTFSGCPGDALEAVHPNWVTCPWPEEYSEILKYQWEDVLIPYWNQAAQIAKKGGVKVALEMHPGFSVYNPETMLKLRNATDSVIGANFDPSHLFWQGIDAVSAIHMLGEAIHYVHAKDCRLNEEVIQKIGVMDTKHYSDFLNRAWTFRTVGYGHGRMVWADIISNLRLVGYDKTISIEHEDALMSVTEGLEKAVAFLKDVIVREPSGEMWWA